MSTYDQTAAVPLSAPLYGATFGQAFKRFFLKYATFSGRASRSEYWWWILAESIIGIVGGFLIRTGMTTVTVVGSRALATETHISGLGWLWIAIFGLWFIVTIIPSLALAWRRLHDAGLSGGFFFIGFVPFVGGIILLVLYLLPPKPEGARFDRR